MSTIELLAPTSAVLTPEALGFVAELETEFGGRRRDLLEARRQRQADLDQGIRPDFLPKTASVRSPSWSCSGSVDGENDGAPPLRGREYVR